MMIQLMKPRGPPQQFLECGVVLYHRGQNGGIGMILIDKCPDGLFVVVRQQQLLREGTIDEDGALHAGIAKIKTKGRRHDQSSNLKEDKFLKWPFSFTLSFRVS